MPRACCTSQQAASASTEGGRKAILLNPGRRGTFAWGMDNEAESAPLVRRDEPNGTGLRAVRTVHFARDTAASRAETAVPASAAVFELEEDEAGPLFDGGAGAGQRGDEPQAASQEAMPLWVIPLLTAAVSCDHLAWLRTHHAVLPASCRGQHACGKSLVIVAADCRHA